MARRRGPQRTGAAPAEPHARQALIACCVGPPSALAIATCTPKLSNLYLWHGLTLCAGSHDPRRAFAPGEELLLNDCCSRLLGTLLDLGERESGGGAVHAWFCTAAGCMPPPHSRCRPESACTECSCSGQVASFAPPRIPVWVRTCASVRAPRLPPAPAAPSERTSRLQGTHDCAFRAMTTAQSLHAARVHFATRCGHRFW